jgi:C-terminal processing protease CtpA/Prc
MKSSSRRWLSFVACLLVVTAALQLPPTSAQTRTTPGVVSRADAVADLIALFDALERIHPAPYAYRSRALVEADRRQLTDTLPDSMPLIDWWRRLAPIVANLGDGHTEVPPPISFLDQFFALSKDKTLTQRQVFDRIHEFPSGTMTVDDNRHLLVTSPLGDAIRPGDRVIAINEHDADALLAEWVEQTSGDSDANRRASILIRATDRLATRSIVSPYRLKVVGSDGVERTVSIAGPTMHSAGEAGAASPNFNYRVLEPGIGYMDFYSMAGDYRRFKKALASMFQRVSADGIRTLIIDIRYNTGGYDQFGDELLRYVTRTPYRSWSRQELKRSKELRAQMEIAAPVKVAPLKYLVPFARRIYTGPAGTLGVWTQDSVKTPSQRNPFFSGPVCVLTGARTFSAAVSLADAVKTYRLATLVGEETGGRANMSIEAVGYTLPKSGITVAIASGRTIRANGNADDHGGVIPDIVVRRTAVDIQNGRDPVVDRARDCPRPQ